MRGTQFADLSAFVAVAEQRSFTKAAKQLGISTGTLSQAISSLEERLGMRLLNRTTRSVSLTEVGERLFARLRPVLNDFDAALESVNVFRDRPYGLLRVTVPPPAAEFLLAPVLARFLERFPEIRLEVLAEPDLTDIVTERFDAGIRVGQRVQRDMIAVRISEEVRNVVVASPRYLAQHGKPDKPQDLRAHNCVRVRFPSGTILPWQFEKKGKHLEVAVEGSATVNDPHLATRLAADGVGLLYTLECYAEPMIGTGQLVSVLEDWIPPADAYYLYYTSRRQTPPALQAFVDFLKSEMKARDNRPLRRHAARAGVAS